METKTDRPPLPSRWARDFAALKRDAIKFDWAMTNARAGLVCLPVIAGLIFFGLLEPERQRLAAHATAGAVAVAFAAFQQLGWPVRRTMALTLLGLTIFTYAGATAAYAGWGWWLTIATSGGVVFGAMTMLGKGAWWLGLQWMIALLVFGARSEGYIDAAYSAAGVMIGGGLQLAWIAVLGRWTDRFFQRSEFRLLDITDPFWVALARSVHPTSLAGRYALRMAGAIAGAMTVIHLWPSLFPNGYWAVMTVAILMKPDRNETLLRGFNRLVGTLAGAGLTTLLVATLEPGRPLLGLMLLGAIWACFALQRVHYAFFATFITAYVVLLLSTTGLPEPDVALHRVVATLLGAGVTLAAHAMPLNLGASRPEAKTSDD